MQRRRPLAVERGAAVVRASHGRIRVTMVVGDGGGGRIRVWAADRLEATVAGDGDGAVVAWDGVEQ
jgi:hypothetical protein